MSTATKWLLAILIVFNLFMAALMSLLYGYRVSYKQELAQTETQLENIRKEKDQRIKQLETRRDSLLEKVASLQEERTNLKDQLDSTTAELESARDEAGELSSRISDLTAQVDQLQNEKSELQTKIEDQQSTIETKNQRISQLEERKETISSQLSEVEADLRQKQVSLSELQDRFVSTKSELKDTEQVLAKYKDTYGSIGVDETTPAVEGNVRAVNPNRNLVLVNLGKNDGVKKGMRFSVIRSDKYVTELEVMESYDTWAAARSISRYQKREPQVGDVVTTVSPTPGSGSSTPPVRESEGTNVSPSSASSASSASAN